VRRIEELPDAVEELPEADEADDIREADHIRDGKYLLYSLIFI
jgi:hypothetical protein